MGDVYIRPHQILQNETVVELGIEKNYLTKNGD